MVTVFFEDNVKIMKMVTIHQMQLLQISMNTEFSAKSAIEFIQNSMSNISNVGMFLDFDCQYSVSILKQVNPKHTFETKVLT